ncbi:MAG: hypothetical protein K1060chlam4_00383 [Candidatus Anoxychlamydiales bacterium]|nr:hypothetical protein [Candidatus Anoxychlamydiales bacterium]
MNNKKGKKIILYWNIYVQVENYFEKHRDVDPFVLVNKLIIKLMQSYDKIQDSQLIANLMNLISSHLYECYNDISHDIDHSTGNEKVNFKNILHNEFLPN